MQHRALASEKITVHSNKKVADLVTMPSATGQERLEQLLLQDTVAGTQARLRVAGLFVAIGHHPNSDLFKGQLALDENDYTITEQGSSHTNVPGVFTCGDVQDTSCRQAITAAGSGCIAAVYAERWLAEHLGA